MGQKLQIVEQTSRVLAGRGIHLVLLAMGLGCTLAGGATDYPFESETPPQVSFYERDTYQRIGAEEQERFRKRVPISAAVGEEVEVAASARPVGSQTKISAPIPKESLLWQLLRAAALGVAVALVLGKLAPRFAIALHTRFNPWVLAPAAAGVHSARSRAEEEDLSEFLAAFRLIRPAKAEMPGGSGALPGPEGEASRAELGVGPNPVAEFLGRAPERLGALRKLVQEISRASDIAARQKMLGELCHQVRALKGEAGVPELLPAWQMTGVLEGLLKQLIDKASNVTFSTLRTVASGVELLEDLCKPGVRADICDNPPFRLLAVDDEAISRHAVSSALKRGLNQPDLAEHAEAALALVSQHAYDVIFLDVQMPGMDGFDLCSRIHRIPSNRCTPVVFISLHDDFNARAKSVLCSGNDLIGKPFLTFEVTVKALTLALRGRLQQTGTMPAEALAASQPSGGTDVNRAAAVWTATVPSREAISRQGQERLQLGRSCSEDAFRPEIVAQDLVSAFVDRATEVLPRARELIKSAGEAQQEDARQEMLGDLYCSISSLAPAVDWAQLGPAGRVMATLENLLRKLLEHPGKTTPSTCQTLAAAVDLLGDLCAPGSRAWVASGSPVHLLVVDDDPVARRAIAGGLQLVFGQPDTAADGEAALALAAQKAFDVIFMDVQMPGMDGFTACSKIHDTAANRHTPVVFVTSHTGEETRQAAFQSGGSEFITKPFMCGELTLKALTFALRSRLGKLKAGEGEARASAS